MRLQLDPVATSAAGGTGTSSVAGNSGLRGTGPSSSGGTAGTAADGDTAVLSGTSGLLAQAQAARGAQIARLADAVRGGTYDVPSALIGRAIISEAML